MLIFEPQNLTEDFSHIYSGDPALDKTGEDWQAAYDKAHETGDVKLLPLKEGEEPSVFWLRIPRGKLRRKIRDMATTMAATMPGGYAREIVATTLRRVDNAGLDGRKVDDELLDLLEIAKGDLIDELAYAVMRKINTDPLS